MIVPPFVSLGLFVLLVILIVICGKLDDKIKQNKVLSWKRARYTRIQYVLLVLAFIALVSLLIVTFWGVPKLVG